MLEQIRFTTCRFIALCAARITQPTRSLAVSVGEMVTAERLGDRLSGILQMNPDLT
jgi:hypothetical protein